MKVSTNLYFDRASAQLGTVQSSLSKTQEQLSTGKQITKPSDEPDKASLVTRLESEMARQKSYQDALSSVEIKLSSQETALRNVSDVMGRIKELTVQANSDTMGTVDRQSIALEIESLRDQILSLANTQDTSGNYLFAGSRVTHPAFGKDTAGEFNYQGDQTRIRVAVGDNLRMNVNRPGSDAFVRVPREDGKGGTIGIGFFQSLDDLTQAIRSSDRKMMQRGLGELDALSQGVSEATAQVGADLNVVDAQRNVLDEVTLRLKTTMSAVQDLDYTEAITRMNRDQLALEAAQSSFAKISKLSLFNYLN
jgi:flagellar hook-associated protein 3 FlgL